MGLVVGLVVLGGDLGTALVLMAIILGMLWVVGAPARLFVGSFLIVGVVALYLATTSAERLQRLTNFADPFKDYQGAGWQAAHGLFAMSSGGCVRQGHRRQPAEVGQPARGAHRLHLRGARRGARHGRHRRWCSACS